MTEYHSIHRLILFKLYSLNKLDIETVLSRPLSKRQEKGIKTTGFFNQRRIIQRIFDFSTDTSQWLEN